MRARRVGTKSEFRLFQDEREIGHVDVASVSFRGFESRDDAALATWAAQRALTRRRRSMPHRMDYHEGFLIMDHGGTPTVVARAGVLATLLAPAAEKSEIDGWGCEMQLLPEEQFEVFCEGTSYGDMARAAEDGGVPGHTPVPTETPASDPPAGGGVSLHVSKRLWGVRGRRSKLAAPRDAGCELRPRRMPRLCAGVGLRAAEERPGELLGPRTLRRPIDQSRTRSSTDDLIGHAADCQPPNSSSSVRSDSDQSNFG
jgi:hypothetical protein